MKFLFCILFLTVVAFCQDAPVFFVQSSSGNLNLKGPVGVMSTPARLSDPMVFAGCFWASEVDEFGCGSGGELAWKNYRLAFFSSYHGLDSLYRQSYSEVDLSLSWKNFLGGVGYGFSMEWIPGDELWCRSRLKVGGTFVGNGFFLGGMGHGWLSGFESRFGWLLGGGVQIQSWGYAFGEWDGSSAVVGTSVIWNGIEIRSSYSFPDFGVALSLQMTLEWFSADAHYGPSSGKTGWFGVGVEKRIRKMTIL